jgi:sulfoxide reductase heme-binding subunit YedZ
MPVCGHRGELDHDNSRLSGSLWAIGRAVCYAAHMPKSSLALWRDRRGRVSALRVATLLLLLVPILLAVVAAFSDQGFGARPLNDLIHRAGYWTLMFVLLALAITPLTRIGRFGALMDVRRMIGVGAFCYAATHISLYIADQMFDLGKVASEIVLRVYLTIGFTALIGLAILAGTSTDGWVRRLGAQRWMRLHQFLYAVTLLALIHFFQQTKADVWVPTFFAGLFTWLMGYRLLVWWGRPNGQLSAWSLLALAVTVSALTFAGEAIGIGIAYNVSPWMVLETAFDLDYDMVSPGWLVLAAGLCVVALDLARGWWRKPRRLAAKPANPVSARAPVKSAPEAV